MHLNMRLFATAAALFNSHTAWLRESNVSTQICFVRPASGSSLASWTIKTRTLSLPDLLDICTTLPAALPGSTIHQISLLKTARVTIATHKIAQTAASRFNRKIECVLYCLGQFCASAQPKPASGSGGIDARSKERFVSVNIPDADDDAAVHQHFFDAGATTPGCLV